MDKENQTNLANPILRKKIASGAVIIFVILIFNFGEFWVNDKCSIIDCEPASWGEIQEIVIKNTTSWGTEYKLDDNPIHIRYSNDNGVTKSVLLEKAEIRVTYVSTYKEINDFKNEVYPERIIEFDDNNLQIKSHKHSSLSIYSLPPEETLNRFKRVSVGYKDVYDLTWDKANKILNSSVHSVHISLSLEDEMQEGFNAESVWFIFYLDNDGSSISYWVDAQTGKILYER